MKRVRRLHCGLGMFFAPTILFFSVSGALQALELHEQRSNPPDWLRHVAQVHKNQTWTLSRRAPPPGGPSGGAPQGARAPDAPLPAGSQAGRPAEQPPSAERPMPAGQAWLKRFVVTMALGLVLTTCLGLWIAFSMPRDRVLKIVLLVAGTAIPVALLLA